MPLLRHLQSASMRMREGLSLKGAAVVLILAMHVLGLYFLLLPPRQLKQYTEVAFMTLLPPRPTPQAPPMPLPMPVPMPRARGAVPPVAPSAIVAPPAVAAEAITVPAEEFPAAPATAPSVGDLRTRARLAAGAADKALRGELKQDKPWLATAELKSDSTFQKLVASAWRGGPVIRVEEYLTADGRPVTRVVSAGGATCFGLDANPGAGADPFKTGGKVKRVPCPG
ncbi:hypothetical protein VM94_04279 [Janthinobacterium sp. KBS0711]|uniref:hypothetical protein n=1 Tax=Janthinobacterium sp. KBS0711 TaxID=1649647 RepID=UPI0006307376|nr:hypothetical protein [Janthinobacterium sp. KBS0711]KKO62205.1 hypothetical protein VM94_04279 [Janthinobacterium sp. KBS0711]TSD72185.1 hypothetical protein FFI39_015070 [Janthinobacterium sp. KBS0711]